jgi:hypothetical protein
MTNNQSKIIMFLILNNFSKITLDLDLISFKSDLFKIKNKKIEIKIFLLYKYTCDK